MKTIKLITLGLFLFIAGSMHSQVSVNVNIGSPPAWGPAGYANVEYYYLPDIESYYDVHASLFIYFNNGRWIRSKYLPGPYRNYDLYGGYKVVLHDYHGRTPYKYFKNHKAKYYKGYKGKPQTPIGKRHNNQGYNKKGNNGNNQGNNHKKH
jgi:hypothetical protein